MNNVIRVSLLVVGLLVVMTGFNVLFVETGVGPMGRTCTHHHTRCGR